MNFQWETNSSKLLRSMKIPAQKKLEWLYAMHEFARSTLKGKSLKVFFSLRGSRRQPSNGSLG